MNTIAPGTVDSPLMAEGRRPAGVKPIEVVADRHALGRAAASCEIAAAITLLLSDDSSFMTRAVVSVDGRVHHHQGLGEGAGTVKRVVAKNRWVVDWAYSRAARIGNLIEVGGTTAGKPDGTIEGPGDLYAQTAYALSVALAAVEELGGTKEDILRTRVYLRNVEDWREAGRAHVEMFGDQLPASTVVGGMEFLHPDLLVEVEVTAYLEGS